MKPNRLEILQNIKNSGEKFHQPTPPPAPQYNGGGMNLRVRLAVYATRLHGG